MKSLPALHRLKTLLVCAAGAALVAACGGGGTDSGTGTLRLALTDAPACGYDAVNVTVEKVRVHRSASAGETDAGWAEIVLSPARRVNLLTLTNGALEELGQTPLPAGTYTQMRLVLARNDAANPLANSVLPTGGTEVALTTPSAQQSGLKLNVNITVQPDQLADFVIDFDACKSVVKRGNSGQYNLKPVLAVLPRLAPAGARVVGYLAPSMAGASVSVQVAGVPQRATVPDPASGRFDLYPVPPGTYDLVISGAGRVTAVMTGVPVVADAYAYVNASASPIDLPAGAPRTLSGSLTANAPVAPTGAGVRALQSFTGGPTVEVAALPVDLPGAGTYALGLASAAPVKTAWVAGATAVAFAADPAAAGLYTIEATVEQAAPAPTLVKTAPANVGAAVPDPLAPLAFVFP